MGQIVFAVYHPPEKGLPYLAVRIDGVKTKFKTVRAVAAKTQNDADVLLEEMRRDLMEPEWRARERLRAAYGSFEK